MSKWLVALLVTAGLGLAGPAAAQPFDREAFSPQSGNARNGICRAQFKIENDVAEADARRERVAADMCSCELARQIALRFAEIAQPANSHATGSRW